MDANANARVEVLVFEDNPTDALLIREELLNVPELEVELTVVPRLADGLDQLRDRHFDLALLDLNLPDSDGESTLKRLHNAVPLLPIIVVTGRSDDNIATAMLRSGAQDCLIKGRLAERMLARTIRHAIERHQSRLELHQLDLYARRLEKGEASIRTIVEACTDAILMIDESGVIRFANPAASTLFGRTLAKLIGQPFGFPTIVSPHSEVDIHRPDGVKCLAEMRVTDSYWEGDPAVLATLRDITERKRAEEQREALLRELADKNEQLERIIYTVSHDLKSPLITIRSFAGMVADDMATGHPERMKPDLDRIEKAAHRMNMLLEDLLNFSRLGRVLSPSVAVSISEVAEEARELVAGQLMNRGAKVTIQPDMPVVLVERLRMVEVMQNLIDNAVKFMGDQPAPRIEIGCEKVADETRFFVRDNGIGLEPRFQERVFRLFDKLNPKSDGTGIGLSLVKRTIEMHGGRIWVESEGAGQGSTFWFTLLCQSPGGASVDGCGGDAMFGCRPASIQPADADGRERHDGLSH